MPRGVGLPVRVVGRESLCVLAEVYKHCLPQAEPLLCEHECVISRNLPYPCNRGITGVLCAQGGAGRVGIHGLGRAGQCLCAFGFAYVQICVSVRCFGTLWSVVGHSRAVRAVRGAGAEQAPWHLSLIRDKPW